MKPAVKLALAYCYATGELPSHLHLSTWSQANELIDLVPYHNKALGLDLHRKQLTPEALAAIASHPLKVACDRLKALGFKVAMPSRSKSHYVAFSHPAIDVRGLAYRHGGGSVTVQHGERPYVTSLTLEEAERVWPAILRPAHYVGDKPEGETGRDYLARAMTAYLA